jgi:transcription elongation factor GreA
VVFGSTVLLTEEDSEEEKRYQIVGEDEADIKEGKISFGSPIARALIGKFVGDIVDVQTPGGLKTYEIVDVQYI